MSYMNGVGGGQQVFDTTEVAQPAGAGRAAKTDPSSGPARARDGAYGTGQLDRASVSTAAGLVAQALSQSDVRTEKVAALQQSVAAGTYNVPASSVADKLISTLLQ